MLSFSDEQVTMLEDELYHRFLDRVVAHLDEHCSPIFSHLSPEQKFAVARSGCDSARKHGVEEERGLILYASLATILGCGFDTDPTLAWAGSMLADPTYLDASEQIDDLWGVAMAYLDEVFENEDAPVSFDVLDRYRRWIGSERGEDDPRAEIEALWPDKSEVTPDNDLQHLYQASISLAQDYGFTSRKTMGRFTALAFVLGHRFDIDPLYPWAKQCLTRFDYDEDEAGVMDALEQNCLALAVDPALEHHKRSTAKSGEQ